MIRRVLRIVLAERSYPEVKLTAISATPILGCLLTYLCDFSLIAPL